MSQAIIFAALYFISAWGQKCAHWPIIKWRRLRLTIVLIQTRKSHTTSHRFIHISSGPPNVGRYFVCLISWNKMTKVNVIYSLMMNHESSFDENRNGWYWSNCVCKPRPSSLPRQMACSSVREHHHYSVELQRAPCWANTSEYWKLYNVFRRSRKFLQHLNMANAPHPTIRITNFPTAKLILMQRLAPWFYCLSRPHSRQFALCWAKDWHYVITISIVTRQSTDIIIVARRIQ